MSELVIDVGEKLHVLTRRRFKEDIRRHFAGTVMAVSGTVVRIEGIVFVFDSHTLIFSRRQDVRTRILDLSDAGHIVMVLPQDVVVERLRYVTRDGRLVVTDGSGFSLDINEFSANV